MAAELQEHTKELQKITQRQKALIDLGQKLTSNIQLNEQDILQLIYQNVYEIAAQWMDASNMYVALYNESNDIVSFGLVYENGEKIDVEKNEKYKPRPAGKGKTEWIIRCKEPLIHRTRQENIEWYEKEGAIDYVTPEALPPSWAGIPIMTGDNVLGVIATYPSQEYYYTDADVEILQAMGHIAAIALENARLYAGEQRQRQMSESLRQVATVVNSSLDQETVLERILEQLQRVIPYDSAAVFIRDGDDLVLSGGALVQEKYIGRRIPLSSEDPVAEAFQRRQLLVIPDVRREPRWEIWDERIPIRSWMCAPLFVGEKGIGVLTSDSSKAGTYKNEDAQTLQIFANQAAIAIDNARLTKKLISLIELGQKLTSSLEFTEDKIFELIYNNASNLMDTDNMFIALYDEHTDIVSFGLVYVDGNKIDIEKDETYQPRSGGRGKTEEIIRTKKPLFLQTVAQIGKWYQQTRSIDYARLEYSPSSWLGVPMLKGGEKVVGVIATYPRQEYYYTEDDVEILQAMANTAAIAIENARLYDEQKWVYLGRIAGSLAHRIGNKGGMIRLCVKDLEEYFQQIAFNDEFTTQQLDTIKRNNQYLLNLSEFLFKPQKAIKDGIEKTDIIHCLQDARRYADIPKEVSVIIKDTKDLPHVVGNKYLVEVFLELIVNAIEAMADTPEKTLKIHVQRKEDIVQICFSDTGVGVISDDQETIFELFSKSTEKKLSYKGHQGFGLWWGRTFLREVGGDIRCEKPSDRTNGADFIVELPIMEGKK